MTFRLGLTGSIGMGKSTTAQMFADEGVPVWDADAAVHRLYAKGGAAVKVLQDAMPSVVRDGEVSRELIKQRIAEDPNALAWVERHVHPLVAADRALFAENSTAPITLFDVPLLFETGSERWMDAVVVVSAPAEVQEARAMARPGMTREQLDLILSRQMPDADKRARADYIVSSLTMDGARASVREILAQIKESLPDATA
ncbi:dephospho-CoA kinase [Flavimaricola marinus]|uniref:Dephospho-CoA kinase n=1 Tax=Flavimaricola marinus TaxID=1819565 RepID=A0A238LBT8_9RHOB|nr:dephospho-CoA kinase [Flavimaricola marinus]SMY07197.1 Dephospho-CoA kinase [Flavimaricola marinus]